MNAPYPLWLMVSSGPHYKLTTPLTYNHAPRSKAWTAQGDVHVFQEE